jgi:hypothetical protein
VRQEIDRRIAEKEEEFNNTRYHHIHSLARLFPFVFQFYI